MKKLLLLLALSACAIKEESGGPFVDAVSSSSYGAAPALSFRKSSKQVRLNDRRNRRPPSDAITAATFTYASGVSDTRAIYRNNEGKYVGFTLSGNTIAATGSNYTSEADVDFAVTERSYTK